MLRCVAVLVTAVLFAGSMARATEPEPIRSAFDYLRREGWLRFPRHRPAPRPAPAALDAEVGDSRDFWTWDLSQMPPRDVLVPSTCRAKGDHVYVFVADDQWGDTVDQQAVAAVLAALESSTPAGSIDPARGILANEIEVFGPIPDALDGDPRLLVLLMELQDYGGSQFDGYFNPYNQYPDEQTMADYGYHSNECEMITVNSAIRSPASDMTLSIFAHELEHLIHWGGDPEEVAWVDESCAEAAMVLCGYLTDIAWMEDYLARPQEPLYESEHVHYGACLLFGSYLYQRFGAGFLSALVADPGRGEAGFAAPLHAAGVSGGMEALLLDWATATAGDALGAAAPRFSHPLLELDLPALAHRIDAYPQQAVGGSLPDSGAAYVRLAAPAAGDLRLTVTSAPAGHLLWRVLLAAGGEVEVLDATADGLRLPFAGRPDASAILVLLAHGGPADYTLDVAVVAGDADGGADGGTDGGVDGAADGGADPDPAADADPPDGGQTSDDGGIAAGGSGSGCGCSGPTAPRAGCGMLACLLLAGLLLGRRR